MEVLEWFTSRVTCSLDTLQLTFGLTRGFSELNDGVYCGILKTSFASFCEQYISENKNYITSTVLQLLAKYLSYNRCSTGIFIDKGITEYVIN